jgi:hypothetical protein
MAGLGCQITRELHRIPRHISGRGRAGYEPDGKVAELGQQLLQTQL